MRALAIVLAALAAPAAAAQQETLRVLSLPETVDFGAPFEVVVERSWPAGAAPPRWSPAALAPLRVRTLARALHETGGSVVERRTLRAWAFALGELPVAGGTLRVRGRLDASAPGAFEEAALPPVEVPGSALLARAAALLLFAAASALLVATLRRRPRPLPELPDGVALLRAWAAAPRLDDDGAALRSALDAALLQRTGVDARARSGPELLAEARVAAALGAEDRAALAALRGSLDLWRYAGRAPSSPGGVDASELTAHARALADALDSRAAPREAAA